jgi:hypothetical protein
VRAAADSNEALTRLVASGELLLTPLDSVAEGAEADELDIDSSPDAAEDEAPELDPDLLADFGFDDVERPPAADDAEPRDPESSE